MQMLLKSAVVVKSVVVLSITLVVTGCGVFTAIEATGSGDKIEIARNKDFRVEYYYEKEYAGGFTGLVFGESFGPAQIRYRSHYIIHALTPAAKKATVDAKFVYKCYYRNYKRYVDDITVKPNQYGKVMVASSTVSKKCSRKPDGYEVKVRQ